MLVLKPSRRRKERTTRVYIKRETYNDNRVLGQTYRCSKVIEDIEAKKRSIDYRSDRSELHIDLLAFANEAGIFDGRKKMPDAMF